MPDPDADLPLKIRTIEAQLEQFKRRAALILVSVSALLLVAVTGSSFLL